MIVRVLIPFFIVLWFLSCANDGQYGGNVPGNGLTPPGQSPSSSNCKEWGGVTCISGGNRDLNFLNFLSSGSLTTPKSIGDISCSPSDSGGIIFKLRVALNSPLQIGSNNTMQPASSALEIQIMDSHIGQQTDEGQQMQPIGTTFQGAGGTIINNKADLQFRYNSNNGWKKIRMEGTIEGDLFKGRILFENEKICSSEDPPGQCVHTTPGHSGVLGNFTSPICPSTFTSN